MSARARLFPAVSLLAACAALECGGAWADPLPASQPTAIAGLRSYVDLASTKSGFDCAPAPLGSGTAPTFRSNDAGTVVWWYCAGMAGQWRVNWAAATAAQLSARNMAAEVLAVLRSSDTRAAFNAAVARNVTLPVNSPALLAVWQPFIAEMSAGKPKALAVASTEPLPAGSTLATLLARAP